MLSACLSNHCQAIILMMIISLNLQIERKASERAKVKSTSSAGGPNILSIIVDRLSESAHKLCI